MQDPAIIFDVETTQSQQAFGAEGWELVDTVVLPKISTNVMFDYTRSTGWIVIYVFNRPHYA